jgi:hypothetical protein
MEGDDVQKVRRPNRMMTMQSPENLDRDDDE